MLANVLDFDIVVRLNTNRSIVFTFKLMSICLGLFYAWRIEFIFTFLCSSLFLIFFFFLHTVLLNTNNLKTQVYLTHRWEPEQIVIISSSCRTISTDIPDPLSPPLPIVHRIRQVLKATPRILTELLHVGSCWLPYFCSAMWRGP